MVCGIDAALTVQHIQNQYAYGLRESQDVAYFAILFLYPYYTFNIY